MPACAHDGTGGLDSPTSPPPPHRPLPPPQSTLPLLAPTATCAIAHGGTFTAGAGCQTDTALACPAGTYGVPVATGKICALCSSGSYSSDGTGCTSCPYGTAIAAAGAAALASCAVCPAGTYAASGSSDCVPCDAGTYQDSTKGAGACLSW